MTSTGRPRLFHFSEDPGIERFVPRPVGVPSPRRSGQEWLNGPIVWAVTEERQAAYLFPRDCPRILLWLTPRTSDADRAQWWGSRSCTMLAHVEWAWRRRIEQTVLYRYELPADGFEAIDGDWTWISRDEAIPMGVEPIPDLLAALEGEGAELRFMPSLVPLRGVWDTTLHASGIRLRNAAGWDDA